MNRPTIYQPPPHSVEAEQAFLSSAMQARELRAELTPDYFFVPQNRRVFEYLEKALREGKPVEPIAFSDYLQTHNVLDSVGGRPYVSDLYAMVPSPVLAQHYAKILREKYLLRQVIDKCTECVRVAYDDQTEVNDVLEQTQASLTKIILESQQKETIRHISEGEEGAYNRLKRAWQRRGKNVIDGIATGFYDFDRTTTGLLPGQFIVLGARPSQGKTSLALNFAANISLTNQIPVGLFSLEMSYEQLWNRLLSYHGRISRQRWRDGFLKREHLLPAKEKAAEVAKAKLWIDDTPGLSVHQFRSRSRLMKLRFKVQVIVLDYVQIMTASRVRGGKDPRIEVNEISATLKSVAKELGVTVIACAQLNRQAEEREFGKPRMADLKESGALEQDADCVAMLWRPVQHIESHYHRAKLARELKLKDENGEDLFTINKKTGKLAQDQELSADQLKERDRQIREYAELIIVKQRDGPTANIPLRFVDDLTRFENRTEKMWSNNPAERQQNVEPEPEPEPEPAPAPEPNEDAATLTMIKKVFPNAEPIGNGEQPF